MRAREYEVMAAVEDRHFWFVQTRGIIRDAMVAAGIGPDSRVMDLGCGTGGTMRTLRGLADWTGVDVNPFAAQLARERSGAPVRIAEAAALPFPDATFDGVTALDVLEHIPDDAAALAEVRRVLKPGGALIATVPCHPILFSDHDRALQHVRRYTRAQFLARVGQAGFVPERVTWVNALLFPLAAAARLASRARPARGADSDAALGLGPLNGVFNRVFGLERRMLRHVDMPFGLTLLVVAR
jgi:ubiquinone/menaquinone biosynthesis C-methylase UbiE